MPRRMSRPLSRTGLFVRDIHGRGQSVIQLRGLGTRFFSFHAFLLLSSSPKSRAPLISRAMSRRYDESDSEIERAPLYDPPVSRRRSVSASSAPRYRRGSVSAATRVPLPPDSDSDRSTDGEYENAADGLPARMSRPVPNRRASVATLSDDEMDLRRPGEDDGTEPTMIRPSRGQYPGDLFGDNTSGTEPRRVASMSKGWEKPGTHHSNSMEDFLASVRIDHSPSTESGLNEAVQIYDLGKTIDNLENDIDQINALRIKIKKVRPRAQTGIKC